MKKIYILVLFLILTLFLISCTTENKLFCNSDNDCICDGIDKQTNNCYLGNVNYYEKNVNKTQSCPDFCTGIANNFAIKCVNNECKQVNKLQQKDCSSDADCMKSGCSGQLCIPTSQKQDSFSTCEFKPEYECYSTQGCLCQNNKCSWSNTEELNACIKSKSQ